VERLSERAKQEIERRSALGLPSRLIGEEIGRDHRTVWGHLARLRRPPVRTSIQREMSSVSSSPAAELERLANLKGARRDRRG
jgi:IS30 family transposase